MAKLDTDIRLRISDDDKALLEDIAFEKGFNLSTYIRTIIKKEIEEWKTKKKRK